ncbi:MAG: chemoreceptor glutamine deamidase CheD [Candidatus Omnitrophota bacterium]
MKEIYVQKFNQNIKIINIGEYYATGQSEGIATVLGSCVSACIYEAGGGVGGMNHILLPGDFRDEEIFLSAEGRYGMFAMELLLGELIKLKVDRSKLRAKIFGGAEILPSSKIGQINIKFIKTFLELERIPIENSDLGGKAARKVFFFPQTGKAMVKKVLQNLNAISNLEENFREKIKMEM